MIKLKKSLAAASAVAALSGVAISSAATSKGTAKTTRHTVAKAKKVAKATTGTTTRTARATHTAETPLTGDTATKVSAAALASTAGGTVIRTETNTDGGGAYEAHVRKADGTEVTVLVDESFKVVGTETRGCHGGRGHGDGHRGGNDPALTGDTLAKATAAALAKTGGGTVERTEADTHGGGAYEVHVLKTDGTRVEVVLDSAFAVVAVETHG